MPPKRVSMAPGTKTETATSGKVATKVTSKVGSKSVSKPENINPIQRSNINRASDLRHQRDKNASVIAEEQYERERELRELRETIAYYKRDNEKIIKQQKAKFGTTLDDMKYVKEDLALARAANDKLYREVEMRKEECDKLEATMGTTLHKINEHVIEISDLNREKKLYEADCAKIQRIQAQMQRFTHYNLEMRNQLLKHKINPNSDASKIKSVVFTKSPLSQQRSQTFQSGTKLPVIYDKQSLVSFRSMEDLQPARQTNKRTMKRTHSYPKKFSSLQELFRGKNNRIITKSSGVEVYV